MKDQFVGIHMDFLGFAMSLLCAIHCAGLPLLLSLMPLLGLGFLENPWIEYGIIMMSFLIASYALARGYIKFHKKPLAFFCVLIGFSLIVAANILHTEAFEIALTSSGALIVSLAHFVNWIHIRKALIS